MDILFIFLTASSFVLHRASSAADTEGVLVSVIKGDSVTLNTGVAKKHDDRIKWYFNGVRIAQINGDPSKTCTDVKCNEGTETFEGRLKLDPQTGSLTITNTRITDSGEYQLLITSSESDSEKIFSVSVLGVPAVERGEIKRESVKEGESVTLNPGVTKNQNDSMTWYYNKTLIVKITGDQSKIFEDVQCAERFRDRLKVDHQTGSLTIMDVKTTDSGLYQVSKQTSSTSRRRRSISSVKNFEVTVTGPGPSSGPSPVAKAGILTVVVMVFVAAVVGVIYTRHRRSIKDMEKQQRASVESPIIENHLDEIESV